MGGLLYYLGILPRLCFHVKGYFEIFPGECRDKSAPAFGGQRQEQGSCLFHFVFLLKILFPRKFRQGDNENLRILGNPAQFPEPYFGKNHEFQVSSDFLLLFSEKSCTVIGNDTFLNRFRNTDTSMTNGRNTSLRPPAPPCPG